MTEKDGRDEQARGELEIESAEVRRPLPGDSVARARGRIRSRKAAASQSRHAAPAVSRKSKGDVSSGGNRGEAYATPENTVASDQSAGDAARRMMRAPRPQHTSRAQRRRTAAPTARGFASPRAGRSAESTATARTVMAADSVAACQRARVAGEIRRNRLSRSAGDFPRGLRWRTWSRRPLSARPRSGAASRLPQSRSESGRRRCPVPEGRRRDGLWHPGRASPGVRRRGSPTRAPLSITGRTYIRRRPDALGETNHASSPCRRSDGRSLGRPAHASGSLSSRRSSVPGRTAHPRRLRQQCW